MRILMAGAGGVGGFFGGMLARAGADVTLLAHNHGLRTLRAQGLEVRSDRFGTFRVPVKVIECGDEEAPFDVIFMCVKAYHSEAVASLLAPAVGEQTTVVSLQNGIQSHLPYRRCFGAEKILGGLCYLGAHVEAPAVIRHVAAGRIVLGELDGSESPRAKAICAVLQSAGIETEVTAEIVKRQWAKLVWNVGFNGPTGLIDLNVGEILQRAEQRRLIEALMTEAVAVAAAQGVVLAKDLPQTIMADSAANAALLETSLLHDRRAGRPTEWEIFYGFMRAEGKRLGVATPANDLVAGLLEALDPRPRIV